MKGAVVFTKKDFVPFAEQMYRDKKYEIVHNKKEIIDLLKQLEAKSPYPHPEPGLEEGFSYFRNGLRAYIWSTFVMTEGTTRDGWDAGRVLITENGRVVYYGPEIRRTERYFERLLLWADILKERVSNRPSCPCCKRLMSIYHSENGQYYWYCENKMHEWIAERWDIGLSEKSLDFLCKKRNRTRKYNIMRLKAGKPKHGTARKNRKRWTYKTPV